jgi:glycosyltransferase involved in cell wall biosynthesis
MTPVSRVLYVCGGRSFFSQAPFRKLEEIISCWNRLGFESMLACGGDLKPRGRNAEYGAAAFHGQWYRRLRIFDPVIHSISERRDIAHDRLMESHLERLAGQFKPDVVWERSSRLHCAGLTVARRRKIPYVLEWKDNIAQYGRSWYGERARGLEKHKNGEADFIVVESDALRAQLNRQGVGADKILVAHNAADPEQFRPSPELRTKARAALGIKDDEVLIGYVGSYAWYHDTPTLVTAMEILKASGIRARCLMVGSGKRYDETRQLARKKGLLDTAIIMKPGVAKTDVPATQSAMDIAVLPGGTSIICPIKIQEYMASGLATVAPDYDCNREVIEDGQTGVLFSPGDSADLSAKLGQLAKNAALRETLGRGARRRVENRFTWERTWGAALQAVSGRI